MPVTRIVGEHVVCKTKNGYFLGIITKVSSNFDNYLVNFNNGTEEWISEGNIIEVKNLSDYVILI